MKHVVKVECGQWHGDKDQPTYRDMCLNSSSGKSKFLEDKFAPRFMGPKAKSQLVSTDIDNRPRPYTSTSAGCPYSRAKDIRSIVCNWRPGSGLLQDRSGVGF